MVREIGAFDGGTSVLLSRLLPTVELMICIDLFMKNNKLLRTVAPAGGELRSLDRSSYAPGCVDNMCRLLGSRTIDVLFIDGDHPNKGVKQEFPLCREFVREGGLAFFQGIVESHGERACTGGVPKLRKELAPLYPHREFVESWQQDGFGIGVLEHRGAAAIREQACA